LLCGSTDDAASTEAAAQAVTNLPLIDNTKWQYNEADDVYYQLGISYCENPADATYEELAVIVPAAYMDAAQNADGTYTCTLSKSGEINGYTASTAPHRLGNRPGSMAMPFSRENMPRGVVLISTWASK